MRMRGKRKKELLTHWLRGQRRSRINNDDDDDNQMTVVRSEESAASPSLSLSDKDEWMR